MNKGFIFVLGAVVGSAIGSLVTWKIVEEKYKRLADEEIESVVERFKKRQEIEFEMETTQEIDGKPVTSRTIHYVTSKKDEDEVQLEKELYVDMMKESGYIAGVDYGDDNDKHVKPVREYIKPYIISPEEYGEFGNTTISLMYYADFTLVDEEDQIISDPESIIGDALAHFGKYEDDAVHVRDENLECDYEILRSEKTFSEVYGEGN